MREFTATIVDPIGFHARPAARIAAIADTFKDTNITIAANGKSGNLKSIMNIMAMGIKNNTEIHVVAEGDQAEEAINAIQKSMRENKLI